jgi:hypothetical protein
MTVLVRLVAIIAIATMSTLSGWAQESANGAAATASSSSQEASAVRAISAGPPMEEAAVKPTISGSEAVITIHGICGETASLQAGKIDSCETAVSKEKFEKLLESMNVMEKTIGPETRRNLAEVYAQYLIFEQPAAKAGMQDTQRYEEIMRWWRVRTLAALYRANLQEQFKNPSAAEIHEYYVSHLTAYRRLTIARVIVPHQVPRQDAASDEAKRRNEKALETANAARDRMAKGEDPDVVQKDAYAALGLSAPPMTKLGSTPGSDFPTEETDELFALRAGEVSKVETEGLSYVIYKIVANETLPEEKVKDDVVRAIAQSKYDEAIRGIEKSAKPEFNDAYFGPPAAKAAESRPARAHP